MSQLPTILFPTFFKTLLFFSAQNGDGEDEYPVLPQRTINSFKGLAEACKFVYNDAKYVNERARSDMVLLSR